MIVTASRLTKLTPTYLKFTYFPLKHVNFFNCKNKIMNIRLNIIDFPNTRVLSPTQTNLFNMGVYCLEFYIIN